MSTPLPRGIERDDTVHGRLYYTRAQLLQYAIDYADQERQAEPEMPQPRQGSTPRSKAVDDLLRGMGMR